MGRNRLLEIVLITHPEVVSLDEDLGHDYDRITVRRRRRRLRHRRHPVDELKLVLARHEDVSLLDADEKRAQDLSHLYASVGWRAAPS